MKKIFPLEMSEMLALLGAASAIFATLREFDFDRLESFNISVVATFIFGAIFATLRIWQEIQATDNQKFKIISLSSGDDALKDILSTSESIVVTHFTEDRPTDAYIDLMTRKLNAGVWVTRYLPDNFNLSDDRNDWVNKFYDYNNYVEKRVNGHQLPFDIAIFDSTKVVLSFATNRDIRQFNKAMEITNKEVVDFFRASLEKLEVIEASAKVVEKKQTAEADFV